MRKFLVLFPFLSTEGRFSLHNFAGVPSREITVAVASISSDHPCAADLCKAATEKTELGFGCENNRY